MGKGRIHFHLIIRVFAFALYIVFLWQNHSKRSPNDSILESHRNSFGKKTANALIIGGSNAVFGLSAQILTENTNFSFYNLSVLNNGFNRFEYIKYIESLSSQSNRDKVELIIFSPIEIVRARPFEKENTLVNGQTKSYYENSISIASIAFKKAFKHEKRIARTYHISDRFGDFDFSNFICDFSKEKRVIFNAASVEDSYKYVYRYFTSLKMLFPNARIIISIPSEYDPFPSRRKDYLLELTKKFSQNNIGYIDQSAINSIGLVCESSHHLNSKGREKRSLNLAKEISLRFQY